MSEPNHPQNNMKQLCFAKPRNCDGIDGGDDEICNEIDDGGFADRRRKHKSSSALTVALEKLLLVACLVVSAAAAMLADALEGAEDSG